MAKLNASIRSDNPWDLYSYRVFWSTEDQEFVGVCAELPGLSFLDRAPDKAFRGIRSEARDTVTWLQETGDPIPEPLATRTYSGIFKVRIPPDLHRDLALKAKEQNVSLNRLVSAKLAGEVAEPRSSYSAQSSKRRRAGRSKP